MAWSKLYKVAQDSPVGYSSVNQAGDNNQEHHDKMLVEHGAEDVPLFRFGQPPAQGINWHTIGKHDAYEAARTVGNVTLTAFAGSTQLAGLGWTGPGVPWMVRVSAGIYLFPVLGLQAWRVVPTVVQTNSSTWLAVARTVYPSATAAISGVWIRTLMLDSGTFIEGDTPFTFALYGSAA